MNSTFILSNNMKSIFPVALQKEQGYAELQTGTAFILNFCGYKFIITAWHCVASVIKNKYGLQNDFQITNEMLKDIVEKNIFFGIIHTQKPVWCIPINDVYTAHEWSGNRADIIVSCVDTTVFDGKLQQEETSFNDIVPLELSSQQLTIGNEYIICGYPQQKFQNHDRKITSIFDHRILKLAQICPACNNPLTLEHGVLDFSQNMGDSVYTLEGFSGGPVLDNTNKVIGMAYEIPVDYETHASEKIIKFITANSIGYMLQQCIKKYIVTT